VAVRDEMGFIYDLQQGLYAVSKLA